jgi:hypothetical protein
MSRFRSFVREFDFSDLKRYFASVRFGMFFISFASLAILGLPTASTGQSYEYIPRLVPSGSRVVGTIDTSSLHSSGIDSKLQSVFSDIERGIMTGDANVFSQHLARQVYLNVHGVESGYYSGNQALAVLQNFLGGRKTLHFRFTTIDDSGPTPYATGGGMCSLRGAQETIQIYAAVSQTDDRWFITQFNVY